MGERDTTLATFLIYIKLYLSMRSIQGISRHFKSMRSANKIKVIRLDTLKICVLY